MLGPSEAVKEAVKLARWANQCRRQEVALPLSYATFGRVASCQQCNYHSIAESSFSMPTFAEIRAKAEAAATSAKERSQAFSQSSSSKYTPSRPSPALAPKPPSLSTSSSTRPPPGRTSSSTSSSSSLTRAVPAPPRQSVSSPPPLPPNRTPSSSSSTFPSLVVPKSEKLFSQYNENDKRSMFAALDLFFDARARASQPTSVMTSSNSNTPPRQRTLPPTSTIPNASDLIPSPPSAPLSTRPQLSSSSLPTSSNTSSSHPSYPPRQPYSSSALTLSHYILSEPFSSPWFSNPSSPMPPPLQTRTDHQSSFSWQQRNSSKQFIGMSVFGDASVVWYRISWDVSFEANPTLLLQRIKREARYRPSPSPWDGQKLYEAHELYGPRLAQYARQAVSRGMPVGRGECWDLAHEGLMTVSKELEHSPLKPFVSIGRTHGQLIFWANAEDKDNGQWYGGDLYVREGDVVEWRSVRIRETGMGQGSYSILGDPDHTTVIVGTGSPSSLPEPSHSLASSSRYSPASLNSLTVVEQSLGQAPTERSYDLSAFSTGEIWIYRPCGMETLLGVDKVEAIWPSEKGIHSWEVGELSGECSTA
ncbi:hypothetical protein JCM3765_000823 [Sporobolomyces pararoseus]